MAPGSSPSHKLQQALLDAGAGPLAANLQSLNMPVITEGRERNLSRFAQLLRGAGFHDAEGKRRGPALDAIFAVKA